MKWNKKFNYPKSQRELIKGQRHYALNEEKLPSVTTILSETQSDEKKESLARWKARVGETEAERIKDSSASRGTNMHLHLERYILGSGHMDLTDEGQVAGDMAQVIIDKGLCDLSEIWGSEVVLFYPGLYAGQTDLVGVYDYENSIVDFKQSNRPKRKEWIEDYYLQIAAYAMAHDYVHGSKIRQGVIMMCTPDLYYQEFIITDHELRSYKHKFLKRLDMYHELKFDEKERYNSEKEDEEYLKELQEKL